MRRSYEIAHLIYVIIIKMSTLLILPADKPTFGQNFGRITVEVVSVKFAVGTPASEAVLVGIPAVTTEAIVDQLGR